MLLHHSLGEGVTPHICMAPIELRLKEKRVEKKEQVKIKQGFGLVKGLSEKVDPYKEAGFRFIYLVLCDVCV